jgi:flagellar hook protein FlgE
LTANGEALGVITDNIANANTTGFKYSRGDFSDIVSKSLKGIEGGNQIGRGTQLKSVTPVFMQGSMTPSDRPTDLAIVGDGFFVIKGQEGQNYTRDGAFSFSEKGTLATSEGYEVLGFKADEKGEVGSTLEPIKLGKPAIEAKKTDKLDIVMNFDARVAGGKIFNPADPDATSDYNTNFLMYDSVGRAHSVKMYANKNVGSNTWTIRFFVKGEDVVGGQPGSMVQQAEGTVSFNEKGLLQDVKMRTNSFNFVGAEPGQAPVFSFGDPIAQGGKGTEGSTMYGAPTDVFKYSQNGNAAGTISGYSFDDEGILSATYSNGMNRKLYQIAISKFESNEGLYKLGNNRFKETRKSGEAFVGKPSIAGRGRIMAKSLESSTTDIAKELINLMQSQRSFQANTKVVTAADEMMTSIINIRR